MNHDDKRMAWVDQFSQLNEREKSIVRTMYGKSNIWKMLDSEEIVMPVDLFQDALPVLKERGYEVTCKRCGGSGKYHHVTRYGEFCFDCGGHGKCLKLPTQRELTRLARLHPDGIMDIRAEVRS